MKKFDICELEVIPFSTEDVITTSGFNGEGDFFNVYPASNEDMF